MKVTKQGNTCVWYDESLLKESPLDVFEPTFWQEQNKVIGQAKGRGITWFVQTATVPAALRHYRRGGLFGKLVSDHYLFTGWETSRPYKEMQVLSHLIHADVNVPRPIAARVVKRNFCYQADLLSEKIADATDLFTLLTTSQVDDRVLKRVGQEIRKMHNANVNHTDLNIHNILIDKNDKVWIIDFDKCCVDSSSTYEEENISRLWRSFEKEKKKIIEFNRLSFIPLLKGYKE